MPSCILQDTAVRLLVSLSWAAAGVADRVAGWRFFTTLSGAPSPAPPRKGLAS